MKITIDYNNDEIRIEEAGPKAIFKVDMRLGLFKEILEEIFNRIDPELLGGKDILLDVELLTEDEDKRRVIGEW